MPEHGATHFVLWLPRNVEVVALVLNFPFLFASDVRLFKRRHFERCATTGGVSTVITYVAFSHFWTYYTHTHTRPDILNTVN